MTGKDTDREYALTFCPLERHVRRHPEKATLPRPLRVAFLWAAELAIGIVGVAMIAAAVYGLLLIGWAFQ